ncbi:DUF3828 domain-containing protein [Enterobacteriaceae bacterium RIT714]|jgi:hypothetical protein|uniref:DUF3828 domain-containing protein n=1 Tax=Lelliottia sp. CFBP8978 TaxID=3096522 RepID=UPI0012AC9756|nr:DUF3828 domain-containing protein [Lelliottia sp. CFBP8978]MDY1035864.1 DUF3828 domain-containing protein [Lelliottia sp. CFBP8978]MRS89057.1 DUF3828 domain-containing protein [Enterobacteriaceae bacterium RIT714]
MKKIILLLLIASSALANTDDPALQAVKFNKWYVSQISENKFPITDSREIDQYVTASTMQKLRRTQEADYDDEPFYDADLFLKAQDIGDDWPDHVASVSVDTDPVCVNVYIAFGKDKKHTVIDCMVKEDGIWKVQSVAARDFN